jgi:hypothetical protein
MGQRFRRGFTATENTELWERWQQGESLKAIGRAFGKPSSSRAGLFRHRRHVARARSALRRQARGVQGEPMVNIGRLSIDLANRAYSLMGHALCIHQKSTGY